MELSPMPKTERSLCVTKFSVCFFTLSLGFLIDTSSPSILFNHYHKRPPTFCPVVRETIQLCVSEFFPCCTSLAKPGRKCILIFDLIFLSHQAFILCRSNLSTINIKKIHYSFGEIIEVFSHCSHLFN